MRRPMIYIGVMAVLAACGSVPDRFASLEEKGPYTVDDWDFTTRALRYDGNDIDVLVAKAAGPTYFSEDQVLTTSRYVEAALLGIAEDCNEPKFVFVDRAWEALTARSASMVVRFECDR